MAPQSARFELRRPGQSDPAALETTEKTVSSNESMMQLTSLSGSPRRSTTCRGSLSGPPRGTTSGSRQLHAQSWVGDLKSTRLNSSHVSILNGVFCLIKYRYLCREQASE